MIGTFRNYHSPESDRTVIIRVCGGNYCQRQRRSNYTLFVPYIRLNQTIQQIHRRGGKITAITLQTGSLAKAELTNLLQKQQTAPIAKIPESEVLTVPNIPTILLESAADFPVTPPLSRSGQKRRRFHLPGILRRKKRKKSRTKAKIYFI